MVHNIQDAAFPKAAKLLDMVRCSVAFNTVSQLLNGYDGLMNDIAKGTSNMKVARIKNGFLEDNEGGYRDLKINVIFQSQTEPDLKMICEIQLILNQYLFEKKKMHKLYSVIRDEVYYQMVVQTEEESETGPGVARKSLMECLLVALCNLNSVCCAPNGIIKMV